MGKLKRSTQNRTIVLFRDVLGYRYLGDLVVRELLHLREQRHNECFRELIDNAFSYWRTLKDELNRAPLSQGKWTY
ncbi:MAG: DUF45 domain-containing protein [Gammaproteobacteria bacterium]|nr:DUF45 domain-containing protein [Gammaproteobacteria bacterium]MDE1888463.1 DUF45 domain-containing protein [Gammaproteobacteria bacterium]MDE2023735.1 DUF45 domain-containing protein [Gammaproteobacteria bacterium]MDE2139514.1 DUF45 domain-containing protein [Gammaproteobacteria bacterium]MDE2274027.1 DUF45 domain-containing protein [Gammaproteobacteria bacterium]